MRLSTIVTCAALTVAIPVSGKLLSWSGYAPDWKLDWSKVTAPTIRVPVIIPGLIDDARERLRQTIGYKNDAAGGRPADDENEEDGRGEYNGLTEEEATRLVLEQLPPVEVPMVQVCFAMAHAAERHGIPLPFFARLIWQESGFRQRVVSPAGARGVAQFMPRTAEEMGLGDPFDPIRALPASARYLRTQIDTFGNVGLAAAAYNAGARRIAEWIARKGPLPEETRNYVKNITGNDPEKWIEEKDTVNLAQHLPGRAPCEGVAGLSREAEPETMPVNLEAPIAKVLAEAREAEARAKAKLAKAKRTKTKFAARKNATFKMAKKKGGAKKIVRVADTGGRDASKKGRLASAVR